MKAYGTVVIDPPWRHGDAGVRGGTKTHYETMSVDEIAALPVRRLLAPSAHLYVWATNQFLVEAHELLRLWGAAYKTMLTWCKTTSDGKSPAIGVGYYFRGATEHCLFGTVGRCPARTSRAIPTWFAAPRGRHSTKPDELYNIAERMSPPDRLEMFARAARYGWDVHGDQAPGAIVMPGQESSP